MKEIKLTKGKVALVDDDDYEMLMTRKWYTGSGGYPTSSSGRINGKQYSIKMHRLLMGLVQGDKMEVDHIDHDPCNNQRFNLRICTHHDNTKNHPHTGKTSKYLGVYLKSPGSWYAMITYKGKRIRLGKFYDEDEAGRAYDEAAVKYHGEFANKNFK